MKYYIKKIFACATLGAIVITNSISDIPVLYASEFIDVKEEKQDERNIDNFQTLTPTVDVPIRDVDSFVPITPTLTAEDSNAINKRSAEYEQYFIYRKSMGKISITGLENEGYEIVNANGGELIIPDILEELPVTGISTGAFKGADIKSVVIPDSVKNMGSSAFKDCVNLTSVELGSGLESISSQAFEGSGLTSVEIPSSVKYIFNRAFAECKNLTEVTFNEGLTDIYEEAFKDSALESVALPESLRNLVTSCFENNNIVNLDLGDRYLMIPIYAFRGNKIKKLELSPSYVQWGAFANNEIEELYFRAGGYDIWDFAFADNKIEKITFEESDIPNDYYENYYVNVYTGAFYKNNIKDIYVPSFVDLTHADFAFAQNPIERIEFERENYRTETLSANLFTQSMEKETIASMYGDFSWWMPQQEYTGTLEDSILKEAILPDFEQSSLLDPIPIPKYAIVGDLAKYTMNSQVYYEGDTARPDSVINTDEWSSKRDHSEKAIFFSSDIGDNMNPSDYYVEGSIYRYYEVQLIEGLPEGVTFADGSTTMNAKSLMSIKEIEELLDSNPPVKEGYEFVGWDYSDSNLYTTATEELLLDGDEMARYLVSDAMGIKPTFSRRVTSPTIYLEAEEAQQVDAFNTNFDAKIKVYGETVDSLQPNQEFWYSLTDGYKFAVDLDKISIQFDNARNDFVFVKSFVEDSDKWQFMLSEDGTKIYTKTPLDIDKIDEYKPVIAYIENLAIRNDNNFFGNRNTKVIEVFLNINDIGVIASDVIARLDFIPVIDVKVKEATPKDSISTLNDGTVSLISGVRYSFRRNTTYILKLDDEFVYTHDYGDIAQHVGEIELSNTQIDIVEYVPSIKALEEDSPNWRFTLSDDFNSMYIKAPFDLFPEENPDGLNDIEVDNVKYKEGVSLDINNIGIRDITGVKDNYVDANFRPVNITVTTQAGNKIGQSAIAHLTKGVVDNGNGGGSGGGNGGGGNTKPKDEVVVISEETLIDPYLNGYPDGTVKPKGYITRAEVANILYKIYGGDNAYNKSVLSEYSDLVNYAWYSDAVSFVIEEDIFVGYPDGSFKPNELITREEISVVLARLLSEFEVLDNIEEKEIVVFSDIDNSWAKEDIALLAKKGILFGYPDGEFKLKNSTMRAEFASLMNNLTNRPDEYKKDNTYTDLNCSAWYYDDIMNASNYAIKKNK